jgi:hypothetical protein
MVLIELEPEEATRPSLPVAEEQAVAGDAARPSSSAAPEEEEAAAGGKASRAPEEEEDAFEDALTDEQLREVVRHDLPASLLHFPSRLSTAMLENLGFNCLVLELCWIDCLVRALGWSSGVFH